MAGARRRSGGGPGFGQWLVLGCAVVVILGLTFTLGLLVGRQWARGSVASVAPSASEAVRKASAAPSRRGGIAAETMADRVPEPTEKLTFYQTLTEPLDTGGPPRSEPKPVTVPVTVKVSAPAPEPKPTAARVSAPSAPAPAPVTPPAPPAPPASVSLPPAPGRRAATPPPVAKAPAPPAHAHSASAWTVQVGAFKNRRQAEDTRQRLTAAGLEAYVASVASQDGQPRFRVRVGTYRTREEAAVVAERIRGQRSLTAFVTPQ